MKRSVLFARALLVTSTISLLSLSRVHAQTAPPPSAADAMPSDEVVELSPFVVSSSEDRGYRATTTLAGTRIKTDLKDVGSAISVVTDEFLRDTGARNNEDLLVYTANTEVGGIGGNFTANGTGTNYINTDRERVAPQQNTRVRGLTAADNTRDFFISDIPWDSYIVDRVDLQRGPNSILFGLGSPAGIVNSNINTANLRNAYSAEFRFGSYGSKRASVDLNQVVMPNELAFRVAGLRDETFYQQDPAYNRDRRMFGAVRYEPEMLARGGSRLTFRANFEDGNIKANRPRVTPPVDAITPWFTALNRQTFDAQTVGVQPTPAQAASAANYGAVSRTLTTGVPNPNYQPWIDGPAGRIYDGPITAFLDPTSSAHTQYITGERQPDGPGGSLYYVLRGIQPYNVYATKANLPGQERGIYNPATLQDASIFDFYGRLIDGPNKGEHQGWEAFNVALSETYFNNRAGLEFAYDRQKYEEGQFNLLSPNNGQVLTIDVMATLLDGSPNPNVGRPFVASDSSQNSVRMRDRDGFRFTGFAEIDLPDLKGSSPLTRALGRHVFTGAYQSQSSEDEYRQWMRYVADNTYAPASGVVIEQAVRAINTVSYLGPSLLNASTARGANIPNIQAIQMPTDGRIQLFNWTAAPGVDSPRANVDSDFVGWYTTPFSLWNADRGDLDRLYTNRSTKQKDEVKSEVLVWQGHLFNDTIVPTVGWRRDKAENFNAGPPPVTSINQALVNDATWRIPDGPGDIPANGAGSGRSYNQVKGTSTSWSVVAHTPRGLREKLPARMNFSLFYNESDNFRPDASRRDLFGNAVAAATGDTKDYGFVISAQDDRYVLRVNWYETQTRNVTLSGDLLPNFYLIGAGEAWGYGFANWALKGPTANAYGTPGASAFGQNHNLDTSTPDPNDLIDPSINPEQGGWLAYQPRAGETVAQAYAAQMEAINAFLANPPPAAFLRNWGITLDPATRDWSNMTPWSQPGGVVVTGDTLSKGVEFEFTAQPRDNWTITFNASKTKATRSNLAKSYSDWIEGRYALYQTVAGNVRLWDGSSGQETVRSKFEAETYGPYSLFVKLANGSQAPEVRPWRFNLVTNYTFAQGRLAGLAVGGGYRWQDEVIVGYPYRNNTWDVDNPYHGSALTNVDLWIGYERKLAEKYRWRIQLNVRNAFADTDVIPVTVQPDGSPATVRIPEDTVWTLTNTFSF